MGYFQQITNFINAAIGRNQEFEDLIRAKNIDGVKNLYQHRQEMVAEALKEYNPQTHEINNREDKIVYRKDGTRKSVVKRWKLPINYPQYINEIALTFIFGKPVNWINSSEGTDNAFTAFTNLIKSTRFNAKIRQCKRLAGAETQSALLFRVYRNDNNNPDCQLRVLAASKGDEIYTRWDIYENLVSFAWGYYVSEGNNKTVYHFDIFTPDTVYRCKQDKSGWQVVEEKNLIGKIPVIIFQQDKEWKGVEELIKREEYIGSRTADTNDYFSDPMLILNADIIKNIPEKGDENKTLVAKGETNTTGAASYLTWDNAPASKSQEIEWLRKHILTKTFTPEIDFDNMKGLSNVSGKALKQMMLLADIKASGRKEQLDELIDRTANLFIAIIGNVLNISLKSECDKLVIEHEFQEPFGEDVAEAVRNIIAAKDASILSQEGAVERNPLVRDKNLELKRIEDEADIEAQRQADLFGTQQTRDDIYGGAR